MESNRSIVAASTKTETSSPTSSQTSNATSSAASSESPSCEAWQKFRFSPPINARKMCEGETLEPSDMYRTEMCKNGPRCLFARMKRCFFAHSSSELRRKPVKWSKLQQGDEHGRMVIQHPTHPHVMISAATDAKGFPLHHDYAQRAKDLDRDSKFLTEQEEFLKGVFTEFT